MLQMTIHATYCISGELTAFSHGDCLPLLFHKLFCFNT